MSAIRKLYCLLSRLFIGQLSDRPVVTLAKKKVEFESKVELFVVGFLFAGCSTGYFGVWELSNGDEVKTPPESVFLSTVMSWQAIPKGGD